MSKVLEYFKKSEPSAYKSYHENRGQLSWSIEAWLLFAERFADQQIKERLNSVTEDDIEKYKEDYDDRFPDAGIEYLTGLGHGAKWILNLLKKK